MTSGLAILTGVPGWLGNRLLGVLQAGHPHYPADAPTLAFDRVRSLVWPGAPLNRLRQIAPDVDLAEGDIRDPRAAKHLCGGADGATVFHLVEMRHSRPIDPRRAAIAARGQMSAQSRAAPRGH